MRLRSLHDAVLTTGATSEADNCRLTVRDWDGRQPKAVLLDRSRRVKADAPLFSPDNREVIVIDDVDFDKGLAPYSSRFMLIQALHRFWWRLALRFCISL